MHFLALVIGEGVEERMEPHRETYDHETDALRGHWDWWCIGGRWTGWLKLRNGAGGDTARVGDVAWESMRHDGGLLRPYAVVKDGEWHASETWDGNDFIKDEAWPAKWVQLLETLPRDEQVTVVDIHN